MLRTSPPELSPEPGLMSMAPMAGPAPAWTPVTGDLQLAQGELLVFSASLELSDSRLAELTVLLSDDERARAARFRFDKDRRRFIAGRGLLREVLGWVLRAEAGALVFGYTGRGKPVLAAPASGQDRK